MNFTEENLKQLIVEEIESFLNEGWNDDDDPMRALYPRKKVMANLAKLYAYIEDLEQELTDQGVDVDGATIGASGTQIVDRLADTPVGDKPRAADVAATRLINPKK